MKTILRIYDFFKSWMYYPKMQKYLKRIGADEEKHGMSRLQYSLWHSHSGKISDIGCKNMKPEIKDIRDGWKSVYNREPIEK